MSRSFQSKKELILYRGLKADLFRYEHFKQNVPSGCIAGHHFQKEICPEHQYESLFVHSRLALVSSEALRSWHLSGPPGNSRTNQFFRCN